MSPAVGRSSAEWLSFALACVLLAGFTVALVVSSQDLHGPAAPVVSRIEPARRLGGQYFVTVEITNEGGRTAANVLVTAELGGPEPTTVDQLVDFLAADETEDVVFVFATEPDDAGLTVRVAGFGRP